MRTRTYREVKYRVAIIITVLVVTLAGLYWWRWPSSCGEISCGFEPMISWLYIIVSIAMSRLSIIILNYFVDKNK